MVLGEGWSGNQQSGVTGATLANPLRVRVRNQYGVGLPDVPVVWSVTGPGQISESANVTDATGYAQVTLTLGAEAVTHTVTASAAGLAPLTFTATATAPPPPADPM